MTDVRKRIASDERKFVPVVKSQCVYIARIDDFERAHLVTIGTDSRIDEHFVAIFIFWSGRKNVSR
jgi:hypothetical protein